MEFISRIRSKIILSFLFGLAVVAGLAIFGDLTKMGEVLGRFDWLLLVPILSLTLVNYTIRFVKWHYYLKVVGGGAERVRLRESAIVSVGGMSMAMTPGKVGEFLKAYLVNRLNGTPLMVTAPIVIAERVTDGLAMLILSSVGFIFFDQPGLRFALLLIFLGAVALFVVIQWRTLALRLIDLFSRVSFLKTRMVHLHNFYESSYKLFSPKSTVLAVGLGLAGWTCECMAFALVMNGLGYALSLELLLKCTFILAASTLIGSVSLLPGGLGAADASINGLLHFAFSAISAATASAATLLIRFCTLWFGVSLGLLVLFIFRKRFDQPSSSVASALPVEGPVPSLLHPKEAGR